MIPDVRAKTSLLMSQWEGTSVEALAAGILGIIHEYLVKPVEQLELDADIATASGSWLDSIGSRLGFARPLAAVPTEQFDFADAVYFSSGRRLNALWPNTGKVMNLATDVGGAMRGLAWLGDTLYAIVNDSLHTLNITSYSVSASSPSVGITARNLASHNGLLWYWGLATLHTVDPSDGTDTTIGTITGNPASFSSLVWHDDTLYGLVNGAAYTINSETGEATAVSGAAPDTPTGAASWDGGLYYGTGTGGIYSVATSPSWAETLVATSPSIARIDAMASEPEGTGFGQAPFATALPSLALQHGAGDEWYRAMLRARARAITSAGTLMDVTAAAQLLFDGGATVSDGSPPTIRYTDSRDAEYARIVVDNAAALLGLPSGVSVSIQRA